VSEEEEEGEEEEEDCDVMRGEGENTELHGELGGMYKEAEHAYMHCGLCAAVQRTHHAATTNMSYCITHKFAICDSISHSTSVWMFDLL
jgi:hypothetical protein